MAEYKPRLRTQVAVMATFFIVVLAAIFLAAMGYIWFIEHGLKLDTSTKPESIVDRLSILMVVFPIIPIMLVAILVSGIPWMFVVSRFLSWADVNYYTKRKGRRLPLLSDWLDRLWLRMIAAKKQETPNSGSSQ